ncbi:helix-turn-helix domain-containing protein [Pararhizobium sp.]|uniref:helix-turn-helix domain-containing protein n=1 Tax=Pararhizobium sp. TaxID=1977563 RepID=UPI0039C9723E
MDTLRRMLRAAREAVGRSQADAAASADVSVRTIQRMESGEGEVTFDTLASVRDFLETQGVKFLPPDDDRDWGVAFSDAVAPFPDEDSARKRLFDRAPGAVLRAARTILAASQEQLSKQANVAHTTIRRLENSDPTVPAELAYRLQLYFQTMGIEMRKPDSNYGWRVYFRQQRPS